MNPYTEIMTARAEQEQRNRSLPTVPDFESMAYREQPGWVSKQTGRLINALGNGLSALGTRLSREQDLAIDSPVADQQPNSLVG